MIDVCSCSPEVWHGIKSYVDALVTKYNQEIGISEEEVNIAIVAFADTVKLGFRLDQTRLDQARLEQTRTD